MPPRKSNSNNNINVKASSNAAGNKSTEFVVDGISLRSEFDAARLKRNYHRRPDKHPFIIDAPSSIFFATRSMPQTNTRYPTVVGEMFWRLAAYIDSVPSRVSERTSGRKPHVLLSGPSGSGKSYLLASLAALMGCGVHSPRLQQYHYLSADYFTVLIGDCRRWIESDDPLTYFRMELLAGFRDHCTDISVEDHHSEDHLGCLICVEPFTRVDQVRQFMERCCSWIRNNQPDSMFVFLIDQAEEILQLSPTSIPYQILQILIDLKGPLVLFSVQTPYDSVFPFQSSCGINISMPYRVTSAEFAKHVEVHGGLEERLFKEASWWKDMRLWCGSVPVEIKELIKITGSTSMPARLQAYRKMISNKVATQLVGINRLDGRQRNILLILLFAVILRVPVDMTGEFNISNIQSLGPPIYNLLLLNCLQTFYHSTDGIITLRDVPAAPSLAIHLALCSNTTLSSIIRTWPALFENVVHAMIQSKLLCTEAKRRMSRFYTHAKFLWGRPDWVIDGLSEMGDPVKIKFRQPRVIYFAGQVPMSVYFSSSTTEADHHGIPGNGDYDSIVFLPGRSSYWFFDFFVYIPEDRRLYAVSTSSVVGTWLKELQTRTGPLQLQQQREEGLLTPIILLDNWREVLKRAGLVKVTIKCCIVKTMELLTAAGYNPSPTPPTSVSTEESEVDKLAQHLESSSLSKA